MWKKTSQNHPAERSEAVQKRDQDLEIVQRFTQDRKRTKKGHVTPGCHELDQGYCAFLHKLYQDQIGILDKGHTFPIKRGVMQGDVLSPLLFNSTLEAAIQEWKFRLSDRHGIAVEGHDGADPVTNVRVKLRLRLFDASVSPSLLYSLDSCPLIACQLEKLNVVQRRMIRQVVGWVSARDMTLE